MCHVYFRVFHMKMKSHLGMPLDCDEALLYFCGINRPAAVVGSQGLQIPYLSLEKGKP